MSVKTLYNPASLNPSELVGNFVVRTKSFERIFEDIKSSDMKYPEKHYLIQGQRGMGKTTLLLRLKYEVENSPELTKWLLPVFFNEESYDLNSLSGLWEKLLKFLDDEYETNGRYYEHTEDFIDFDDYEKRCFDYLIEILNSKGKKIILFFDNFGQLFLDNLKEKEKRRLREILMECSEIRIIGASAIVLQDLHDYSQPFFEFFKVVRLDGLSKEETYQLIERLQEGCENKIDLKKNKGKIDTLAILTGGVIRTLMMVYEVLLNDPDGSALSDLEVILDQVTPLYKHRIEDLPIQQRRIVDVIAKRWDAISAKEIATEIREDGKRLQTKLVSAQLAQLEKNNVIEKKQTNTKNHLYQLKERFFNIWYLMRNGDRRDRRRVKWLTKFLEMWYDDEESIESFLERHILRLKSGLYNSKSAILLADALVELNKINPSKLDQMIEATSAILNDDQKSSFDYGLKKFGLAARLFKSGDYEKAVDVLERTRERNNYHKYLLSYLYFLLDRFECAVLEISNVKNAEPEDLELLINQCILLKKPDVLAQILNLSPKINSEDLNIALGMAYQALGEVDVAEKYFMHALDLGSRKAFEPLGQVLISKGDLVNAEKFYLKGYEIGAIQQYDIIDFYFSNFKSVNSEVRKKLITEISPSDPYYNFYHGMDIMYSEEELNDELYTTMREFFENSVFDFDTAKIRDSKYQQAVGNSIILNLGFPEKKKLVEEFLPRLDEIESLPMPLLIYQSISLIWIGKYQKARDILNSKGFLEESLKSESLLEDLNDALLLLLAKHQYHLVLDLFSKNENLKEVLKPTYYALMTLIKDEYPNEIIKMGEELTQPVTDILERIEEMKDEYK